MPEPHEPSPVFRELEKFVDKRFAKTPPMERRVIFALAYLDYKEKRRDTCTKLRREKKYGELPTSWSHWKSQARYTEMCDRAVENMTTVKEAMDVETFDALTDNFILGVTEIVDRAHELINTEIDTARMDHGYRFDQVDKALLPIPEIKTQHGAKLDAIKTKVDTIPEEKERGWVIWFLISTRNFIGNAALHAAVILVAAVMLVGFADGLLYLASWAGWAHTKGCEHLEFRFLDCVASDTPPNP